MTIDERHEMLRHDIERAREAFREDPGFATGLRYAADAIAAYIAHAVERAAVEAVLDEIRPAMASDHMTEMERLLAVADRARRNFLPGMDGAGNAD